MGRHGPGHDRDFDVAEVVRSLEADVVVVAEAWQPHDGPHQLDPLAANGYRRTEVRFTTLVRRPRRRRAVPGEGWWCLSVLTRLPVLARRDLPLGRVWRDPASPRFAVGVTVSVGGSAIEVIGVHASSALYYLGPVTHLRRLGPQLPPPDRPAIVAGDCNLWGPAVERVLPGWRRAVLGRTYPAHLPHSQIDHVLVNDAVTPVDGAVLAGTPSDHRPVRARLAF